MTMKLNTISKIGLLLLLSSAISACGGNKKTATETVTANHADITRPPEVAKDTAPAATETSPDQTVSFDEWRKRRQAEKDAQDQ